MSIPSFYANKVKYIYGISRSFANNINEIFARKKKLKKWHKKLKQFLDKQSSTRAQNKQKRKKKKMVKIK